MGKDAGRLDYPRDAAGLRDELVELLGTIRDEGTGCDTGGGMGSADLWVTVQGVEYFINIRRSNNQRRKDGEIVIPN